MYFLYIVSWVIGKIILLRVRLNSIIFCCYVLLVFLFNVLIRIFFYNRLIYLSNNNVNFILYIIVLNKIFMKKYISFFIF